MRLARLTEPDAFDLYVAQVKADAAAKFEARRAENVARLAASKAERDAYRERAGTPLARNGGLRKSPRALVQLTGGKHRLMFPRSDAQLAPAEWRLSRNEELMLATIARRGHIDLHDLSGHFGDVRGMRCNGHSALSALCMLRRKLANHGVSVPRFKRRGGLPMLALPTALRQRFAPLIDGDAP